jgi:hypothetical protein
MSRNMSVTLRCSALFAPSLEGRRPEPCRKLWHRLGRILRGPPSAGTSG